MKYFMFTFKNGAFFSYTEHNITEDEILSQTTTGGIHQRFHELLCKWNQNATSPVNGMKYYYGPIL